MLTAHQIGDFPVGNLALKIDVGVQSLTAERTAELLFIDPFKRDKRPTFGANALTGEYLVSGIRISHGKHLIVQQNYWGYRSESGELESRQ
jgi:hypothetical protein